jgi:hypothetical protein
VRDGVAYGQQRCARVRRGRRGARARLRGRVGRTGHRQQQGSARTELQRKAASNKMRVKAPPSLPGRCINCSGPGEARARKE